ncbi:MAG TPA: hypothetical protein VGO07_05950 [Candidatus Saccharimonadales bacterium]|jgi:hypothetical protein|nr:hypothetical protein [Candidatus Saccharimonadales bacterium]
MSTETLTHEPANLDPALQHAAEAHNATALREFMEMTQPAAVETSSEATPIGGQLASDHVAQNLYSPLEAPAFDVASTEFAPWYDSSPATETPAETSAPSSWFTPASEHATAPQPLIDQGPAGTHTSLRTGGWVERDAPLREQPEPSPYVSDSYADDAPQPRRVAADLYHPADKLADMGAVVPESIKQAKADHLRRNGIAEPEVSEVDNSDAEADDYYDEDLDEAQDNLEIQDDQDPKPEERQRFRHSRHRRMLITGPATLGAWLGAKQANLAESREATYERLSPGLRRLLRIADGVGVVSLAIAAKSAVQTVLTVKGIMGPSYGTSEAFRDIVDGLTHHHSSLVELQQHDIPPQGGDTGTNTPPDQGYDYDNATRTAHEDDPLSGRASNVTDWSRQALESSLYNAGIPDDEVQRMLNDPSNVQPLNEAFLGQNPIVDEDPNKWLNAEDTYRIGDVDKLADQMAAHRAAALGIHLPDETAPVNSGLGTANGTEETPAPAQESARSDQERYDRWLASQVEDDVLMAATAVAGNAAFAKAGKVAGRDAVIDTRAAGVTTTPPRTGRLRSALRKVLRRGPRP